MNFNMIAHADEFAARAHAHQKRKYTGEPYVNHVRAVAKILKDHGASDAIVAAGLLHDVIEDAGVTWNKLNWSFGETVADLVMEVTDVSKVSDGNRAKRKKLDKDHLENASADGQTIKLADLIDNTSSIVKHDPKFASIYMREKAELLKVLTKGNPKLHTMASKLVDDYMKTGK